MYVYIVCLLITAPTTTSQTISSPMVDMFTTTTQASTATSTSSLINGKLDSVPFVEILSYCVHLHEYMCTLNTVLLHCFAFKVTMALDSCVLRAVLRIMLREWGL